MWVKKSDLLPYFGKKQNIFNMFPTSCHKGRCKRERHVYVDNGAPLLLVAHIDTIQTPRLDKVNRGAGFDDRLGVYTAHRLCNERPDLFDLLLADYEECGASTAQYFGPTHDYNLIIELDREGEDYVDYDLASEELTAVLESYGFKQGIGSFSDICFMDHVVANKINVGLGTYSGHSTKSGFDLCQYNRQMERLMEFVETWFDRSWPEPEVPSWKEYFYGGGHDDPYDDGPIKLSPEQESLDEETWPVLDDDVFEWTDEDEQIWREYKRKLKEKKHDEKAFR